ncbi:Winged helix DNA-binding domain-containing protein [Mycena venus]|uniref:Winged helix DNA-binding domain-containing protein n=1 Tax=Mycena venus TaxID=2733690 RepID=A0A8H6WXA4_9AGAR|nr:Winged helix DNA-binding domain-containing protein [Mycena venus]
MWLLDPLSPEQWGEFVKEEQFLYDALTSEGEMDFVTDESLGSTSSPGLSICDLLVDSDENYVSFGGSPQSHDNRPLLPDYPLDLFNIVDEPAGGRPESKAEREGGRAESNKDSGRRNRIQEHDPYHRPSQIASTFIARHSAQPDLDPTSYHSVIGLDPVYQSTDKQLDAPPSAPTALPSSAFCRPHGFPDAGEHLRNAVGIPRHLPISLASVLDPPNGEKPPLPYQKLMQLAIYGSEHKSLTLQGIYAALATQFEYFRAQDRKGMESWRNSIRHALSLYSVFVKIPRPQHVPGKGSYWVLDIAACIHGPYGRLRKRKNRPKGSAGQAKSSTRVSAAPSPPRKRTRPSRSKLTNRKVKDFDDTTSFSDLDESDLDLTLRGGAHCLSSSSVSSEAADASSSDSATRVSSRLRSRSGVSSRTKDTTLINTSRRLTRASVLN